MQATESGNKTIRFDDWTKTLFLKVEIGYQNMTQLKQSINKELKFSFNSINSG